MRFLVLFVITNSVVVATGAAGASGETALAAVLAVLALAGLLVTVRVVVPACPARRRAVTRGDPARLVDVGQENPR